MDRIIELLASVTEDSTIEEARRVIADCIDEAQKVKDDITGLRQSIDSRYYMSWSCTCWVSHAAFVLDRKKEKTQNNEVVF